MLGWTGNDEVTQTCPQTSLIAPVKHFKLLVDKALRPCFLFILMGETDSMEQFETIY